MLFNSFEFLIFLPIVFLLYWFVFKPLRWQNLFIVAVSYIFYGWWDWRFLILIAFTTLCSFASGIVLERLEGQQNQTKMGQRSEYHPQPANSLYLQVLQLLRREPGRTVPTLRRRSGLGDDRYIAAGGHQLLHLPSAQLYHRCVPT